LEYAASKIALEKMEFLSPEIVIVDPSNSKIYKKSRKLTAALGANTYKRRR
jgi:hypothetical protein